MDKEVGIKETKELIVFVLQVVKGMAISLSDGRLSFFDLFNFFGALKAAPAAFKDIAKIREELINLTEDEKQEISDLVAKDLSLDNQTIKDYVHKAIMAIIYMAEIVPLYKL